MNNLLRLTIGTKVIDAQQPHKELLVISNDKTVTTNDGRKWSHNGYLYGSRDTKLLLI